MWTSTMTKTNRRKNLFFLILLAFSFSFASVAGAQDADDKDNKTDAKPQAPAAKQQQAAEQPAQQPKAQPKPAAPPATAKPQPDRNGGEGRKRPAQQPSRQPKKPSRPSAPAPKFQMAGGAEQLLLRLTPELDPDILDVNVTEGSTFTSDLYLQNMKGVAWNEFRVVLDYNASFVSPISINDTQIADLISGEPNATVDRKLGQVIYEAKFTRPLVDMEEALLFIKWKALKPVFFTPITFGISRQGEYTEIYSDGEPLLGDPREPGDGVLNLAVSIIPSDPAEALIMQEDPQVYRGTTERIGGVQLRINAPEETPRVGDTFSLPIIFDNSAYSALDGLSMLIEYDPRYIQILDDDHDNWITRELNIHDGSYRNDFPWDYLMANAVFSARGLIEYRVGTSSPVDFLGLRAPVAHITVRALEPTAGTSVKFMFSKREGTRTTEVVYLGEDVLGDPDIKNDGVRGAFFKIAPPLAGK